MTTHNICLHKEVKKKYTGYNLKTTEFLDCALIGVCAVIRSNTVFDDVYVTSFFDFLYKSICCGYSFELHQQAVAIRMGNHNICLYKYSQTCVSGHLY